MTDERDAEGLGFEPKHHALLFAWIAREVIDRVGEERGTSVLRKAVWRYGVERGRRMAARAREDDQALDFASYLAYGEWRAAPGETESEYLETEPDLHQRVHRCPWHQAWQSHGLLPYGSIYCLDIDRALVHGFNPALTLDVSGTLSRGQPHCDFFLRGAHMTPERQQAVERRRREIGARAVMPWEYHLGHLYKTVGQVVRESLGVQGQRAMEAALATFEQAFGREAAEVVTSYENTDFARASGATMQ